jgi:peptidoglycan/xylan/chitin deacetylase (PgdA/CDA1 family)
VTEIALGERARPRLLDSGKKQDDSPLIAQPTIVSLTFDDGSGDQYSVRSMLAQRSMHATFYINSGTVGTPGVMTWNQLSDLAADGNEIGGHTVDHVMLTTVSPSEARRQIAEDRQALLSHGFTVTNFAYPYGDYDASVERIVRKCGYSSARGSWGLCPIDRPIAAGAAGSSVAEPRPLRNAWATRTVQSIRAWHTTADLERTISRAEAAGGGWVTLVFHHVCDRSDAEEYAVSPEILGGFLDWLERRAAEGTHVRTVREVVSDQARRSAIHSPTSLREFADALVPRLLRRQPATQSA